MTVAALSLRSRTDARERLDHVSTAAGNVG